MSIEIAAANAVNEGQISTISKKAGPCTNPAQKARRIAAEGRCGPTSDFPCALHPYRPYR